MKLEMKQALVGRTTRRKREKFSQFAKIVTVLLTEEQYEVLKLEAVNETEGNVSQLIRKKIFPRVA